MTMIDPSRTPERESPWKRLLNHYGVTEEGDGRELIIDPEPGKVCDCTDCRMPLPGVVLSSDEVLARWDDEDRRQGETRTGWRTPVYEAAHVAHAGPDEPLSAVQADMLDHTNPVRHIRLDPPIRFEVQFNTGLPGQVRQWTSQGPRWVDPPRPLLDPVERAAVARIVAAVKAKVDAQVGVSLGVSLGERSIAQAEAERAYWDNHTSDGRCKYPATCEADGTHAAPQAVFEYCGRGVCAAEAGHAGTCDEASGWADDGEPEYQDPDGWVSRVKPAVRP